MDWEKILTYGLIGFAVALFMNYLNRSANRGSIKNKSGQYELRMNRLYQIVGLLSIFIAIVFLIAAIYYQEKEMYIIGFAMVLLFGGLGIPLLLYYINHRLIFDEDKITSTGWTKKEITLRWDEITEISFSPFWGKIKVQGQNSQLNIHQHLVGLKEFVKLMENKTMWKASNLKLPIKN